MNRRDGVALLVALLAAGWGQAGRQALRFGVVPYLTARRLATLYEPLREWFEQELNRAVQLSSAPDYAAHLQRLRNREYELVADSLPIARLAQRELGYMPLARTLAPLEPLLVAGQGQTAVYAVGDLRGQAVAVSDRLAALTLVGLRFLRDNGLKPDGDVRIKVAGSHANAIERVLAGDAAAAIISRTTLKQVNPALAAKVRVVRELPTALSAVVYSASPALAGQAPRLTQGMLRFAAQDEAGRAFVQALGHQGLVAVGPELAQADTLVVEFYRQLGTPD